MKVVELYRGTNIKDGKKMLTFDFPTLSWWSNDYETLEHYYEGCALKILVIIDEDIKNDYIISYDELTENYTFGYSEMTVPKNAIWYSFSNDYLKKHMIMIEEINIF